MNKLVKAVILSLIICIIGGCAVNMPQRKPEPQTGQVEGQAHINTELTKQVQEVALTVQGVEESMALVIDNQIAVAVKVTGFDRLRLKSIRQELNSQIKSMAPEYDVHVSTDKKLFAQLQKLAEQIKRAPQDNLPAQIKDDYNVIIEDMNG
ncbi:YhcN/YlaJ family sporulation lipoprotein [Desulfoscipio gibsoniae]|uniref:Sporulation lipoprotein YhcN/YlaJ (Spore_YhcN_YlaJ) n=1 Tax=Desulfoscipio gibsoniae DSM 7213 TaxID=767817 RepID=R4KK17_9FIRM|nr:YhcN/YlaJ family sporulation lipoprotein [Desulfoscipio gibsoniae]AGL00890.1 Sporulation lipoprotein YhcN/YlaJ (Spore_YhcN_YlaJ) [Desulfoscipio gibsoniae DSM 7213]